MKYISPNKQNHYIYYLFIANIIAFALIGVSYVVYSKVLKPSEFGLYSIALTMSTFATMLLDGGLRNTIIKLPDQLKKEEEQVLIFLMFCFSVTLSFLFVIIKLFLSQVSPESKQDCDFVFAYIVIYLISYPVISMCTSQMERQLNYTNLAWIESASNILERAMPALLMTFSGQGIYSFVWGVLCGRIIRIICLLNCYQISVSIPSWDQVIAILPLLKEGAWLQLSVALSLLRDNMPVIVVGTLFGKTWIGYYTWGLQLCAISSQVFVQIAVRVSLPLMARSSNSKDRLDSCLKQVKLLSIATTPVLVLVLLSIPTVNNLIFQGRWNEAIHLLPLLFMRMIPGLATTPLGSMLMVEKGGRMFAQANLFWTAVEFMGAVLFSFWIGPAGLAWSYAIFVWLGLLFFIMAVFSSKEILVVIPQILISLLIRPSIVTVFILSFTLYLYSYFQRMDLPHHPLLLLFTIPILLFSYLSEKEFRTILTAFK
jgi:O-antigen/teichoic acid export membrane protein